jgi:anti-sigma-K factor RskA
MALNEGVRKVEERIKADETFRHAVKRMEENFITEIPYYPCLTPMPAGTLTPERWTYISW